MIQRPRARKTTVASLISPPDGFRGTMARKGKKPKDHIKENSKKVMETQRKFKQKEKAEIEAKKEKRSTLKQFKGVSSRVYNYQYRPQTCYGAKFSQSLSTSVDENVNTENLARPESSDGSMSIIQKNIRKACEKKPEEIERPRTAAPKYS